MGIRPFHHTLVHPVWLTPTHVGHTRMQTTMRQNLTVHPHTRGADPVEFRGRRLQLGSSPHTWGRLRLPLHGVCVLRFIPTHVGHTPPTGFPPAPTTVHPHTRGAYVSSHITAGFGDGSSPHTWGIRAGFPAPLWCYSVHPHTRGAYPAAECGVCSDIGSSPHTWGIPSTSRSRRTSNPVHPHTRGAYVPT